MRTTLVAAAAGAAAALSGCATTQSDADTYLEALHTSGYYFVVTDETLVIQGRKVCRELDGGTAVVDLTARYRVNSFASGGLERDADRAGVLVREAVRNLCPRNIPPGQGGVI